MSTPDDLPHGYQALPAHPDQSDPLVPAMGNEEQLPKPEGRKGDTLALYAAITAAAIFTVVTWAMVLNNNPSALGWFAFHPTLQSLAIFFFTLGILTLQPTSQPSTKAAGLQRHQIAMLLGVPTIILGALSIIWNKRIHEAPHFTTWHGVFGILSLTWLAAQFALGAASVWFGGAALGGGPRAKRVWKLSGYVLLPLVLATANFGGAWSAWVTSSSAHGVRIVAYTLAPAVILASLYSRIRPSKMRFL
ncbi:hypothetical protein HETIRDRAFT_448726 [Heterobasidion irregulare TC 32-1]|uniref:Cytochrome b561 domain-containing protein n=1 Tax=Heterobasidion irregulare (strain TC 32-1) TaxID=747525 RepID=W4KIM7_HETIT|nr:uncharacterized protein HETIRDRAFT_448726 [Heterobasidion irregulare TC 32-1]ETW85702.1 hypothetical protein HETIRDRAFT_448726 [Heterobasidion irregulare TC 32-1]